MLRRHYLTWALVLLTCACRSRPSTSDDAAETRSRVVLTTAPDVCGACETPCGKWRIKWGLASYRIEICPTTGTASEQTIDTPGVGVLAAACFERNGETYLVASAIDANDIGRLYRYHDSDEDGTPDESTAMLLVGAGSEPAYITSFHIGDEGRTWLLDRRCNDILLAVDTDSDGWPDSLNAIPFARSDDFTQMEDAFAVFPHDEDPNSVLTTRFAEGAAASMRLPTTYALASWTYTDTDSDSVADVVFRRR